MPQDYIDTQGLSPKLSPEEAPKLKSRPTNYKPAIVRPHRLFSEWYAREMKILINEVLDAREGKCGVSYFDTKHFEHYVGEEEPNYEDWK